MIAGARAYGLKSTLEACAHVDSLGPEAIGEITISGSEGLRGAIFVERGRICWAGARGLARRLGELLRAGDRREALLAHTLESIELLYAGGVKTKWHPREGRSFEPRFTFGTAELLAHVGGHLHPVFADRAVGMLGGTFGEGDWAVAFVRTAVSAFPQPIASQGVAPNAKSVLRYGKWAASALDMISTFTEDAVLAVERRLGSRGPTLVAFREGEVFVAGETGAHGAARILNRRASERRLRGLHADL